MIKSKKKGFTLVEMIIVMSLSIIVITAIFSFFIISKKISSQTEIKSDLQREAAKVQQSIIDVGTQSEQLLYVKGAGGIEINTVGEYKAANPPDGKLSIREFAFKFPKGESIYNISLDDKKDYLKFVYKLENDKLNCTIYDVHPDGTEKCVKTMNICDFVGLKQYERHLNPTDYGLYIKPVEWNSISSSNKFDSYSLGGKGKPFSAIKITINFNIQRGLFRGNNEKAKDNSLAQSINAIVKFRNDDISEDP